MESTSKRCNDIKVFIVFNAKFNGHRLYLSVHPTLYYVLGCMSVPHLVDNDRLIRYIVPTYHQNASATLTLTH